MKKVAPFKLPFTFSAEDIAATLVDRCDWLYWDTVFLRGGALPSSVVPFSVGMGRRDPVTGEIKTKHETNALVDGTQNGFGPTRALVLQELGVYFPLWLSQEQINTLLSGALIEFSIAEKVFIESRFELREGRNVCEAITNTYVNGAEEIFLPAEFSERMVRIRAKEGFAKYIPPLIPFTFRVNFSPGAYLDFEGVKRIMVPTMLGLCDRPVQ